MYENSIYFLYIAISQFAGVMQEVCRRSSTVLHFPSWRNSKLTLEALLSQFYPPCPYTLSVSLGLHFGASIVSEMQRNISEWIYWTQIITKSDIQNRVAVAEKLLDTIMEGPGCYRCHDRATLEHKETNTAQAIGLRDFALGDFALVRKQRFLQVHINMIGWGDRIPNTPQRSYKNKEKDDEKAFELNIPFVIEVLDETFEAFFS